MDMQTDTAVILTPEEYVIVSLSIGLVGLMLTGGASADNGEGKAVILETCNVLRFKLHALGPDKCCALLDKFPVPGEQDSEPRASRS